MIFWFLSRKTLKFTKDFLSLPNPQIPWKRKRKRPNNQGNSLLNQRTPWGGGKKRGVENLMNDTPPKKGFWDPPSYGTFSTPLRCQCSVFPVQKSTTEQTRSSFGGLQKFSGERVLWYVFLPPYVLHPPHITAQLKINQGNPKNQGTEGQGLESQKRSPRESPGALRRRVQRVQNSHETDSLSGPLNRLNAVLSLLEGV